MAREIGVSFALGANLDGSFGSSIRSAKGQIAGISQAIQRMEATPVGKVGASMQSQRDKLKSVGAELKATKSALAGYWTDAEKAGTLTGVMARNIENAERKIGTLTSQLKRNNAAYRDTVAQAYSVSGSVRTLSRDYNTLSTSVDRARRHQAALSANLARKDELKEQRKDLHSRLLGGMAQAATVAIPVKLSVNAEDSFAELKKVMNGATPELLTDVYKEALSLSNQTGKSFEDVVQIMAAGAQSGLGKTREEMRENTEQALQMSIAWGVGVEQSGKSLATWRSSMGMTKDEARHTADVINALSNQMNGEAGEVEQIFTRMGSLMKGSGMASQDIAALGMAFKASGSQVEVAGTAMKNFAKVLSLGNAMTDTQKDIMARLRLDPKQMQKLMQTDAKKAIMMLLTQLKRVPVEMQNAVSMKLFGDESIAAIAPLLQNLGLLTQAFGIANSNVDNSVLEEYQNRMKTTKTEMEKLGQQTRNFGIMTGNAMLPVVTSVTQRLSSLVGVATNFAQRYPNVTATIVTGAGAFLTLSAGGIALGFMMNGLSTTINLLKGGMLLLRGATLATVGAQGAATAAMATQTTTAATCNGATRLLAGGTKILKIAMRGLALATGPVGVAIFGISLLAGFLMENWDVVGPYFEAAWEWICGIFGSAAEYIKGIVGWVFDAVESVAKKAQESEAFRQNTATALNWNHGDYQESTAEDGKVWTGKEQGKEWKKEAPAAPDTKRKKSGNRPAVPKTGTQPPAMPTGAGMPAFLSGGGVPAVGTPSADGDDDTLTTFDDFGDKPDKKKKGSGGRQKKEKQDKGHRAVSIVTLDSGNAWQSVFIPATDKTAASSSGSTSAAPVGMGASHSVPVTGTSRSKDMTRTFRSAPVSRASTASAAMPKTPELLRTPQAEKQNGTTKLDLNLNFYATSSDLPDLKRLVERVRPEFERILERMVREIKSKKERTGYV